MVEELTLNKLINDFTIKKNQTALFYNNESITYNNLYDRIICLSNWLDSCLMIKDGDKCAILAHNSSNWVITYLAIIYSGRIAVLLDPNDNLEVLKSKIDYCSCRVIFYDRLLNIKTLKQQLKQVDFWFECGIYTTIINSPMSKYKVTERILYDNQLCTIMFSSGTINAPKAVALSHKNIMTVINSIDDNMTIGVNVLLILPMHHCFGCFLGLLGTLRRGGVLYISKGPAYIYNEIIDYKPDSLLLVPALIRYLYNVFNFKYKNILGTENSIFISLKYIIVGGAPLHSIYINEFKKWGIIIYVGYGMTESASLISVNNRFNNKIGSVGKCTTFCNIKINNETGEILIRGENVIRNYYKEGKDTNENFSDSWLRTGDAGYLDSEGYLYVTGRIKNLCILDNGEKVCLEELEEHLQSIEIIDECLVEKEITRSGKVVFKAKLWLGDGRNTSENQTIVMKQIKTLNKDLANYKRIRKVQFYNIPLEKTSSGKLRRKIMEENNGDVY